MKGFIEVFDENLGEKRYININYVIEVVGSRILLNDGAEDDNFAVQSEQSYEEIKALIEKAQE